MCKGTKRTRGRLKESGSRASRSLEGEEGDNKRNKNNGKKERIMEK